MKLWRKLAMRVGKQNGVRPGRSIRYRMWMEEMAFKKQRKTFPLLNTLMVIGGYNPPAPKQEQGGDVEAV